MASTGAVFFVQARMMSGAYAFGVDATTPGRDFAWLPSAQTPFGHTRPNGDVVVNPAWRAFFDYLTEKRLGGIAGKSIAEVVSTVEIVQSAAVTAVLQVAAVAQQSQTNAEALSTVREVLVVNAVPGATQIPPVSRNPFENIP